MDDGWNKCFRMVPMAMHSTLLSQAHHKAFRIRNGDTSLQDIDPSIVFGHSAGAITAAFMAAELKRVKTLVLISPAPMPGMLIPHHLQLKMLRHPEYLWQAMFGQDFEISYADTAKLMLNCMDAEEQFKTTRHLTKWSGKIVRDMLFSQLNWSALKQLRQKLQGTRVVVVGGEHDNMIHPYFSHIVSEKLGGHYYELAGAQHLMMLGKYSSHHLYMIERLAGDVIGVKDFNRVTSGLRHGHPHLLPLTPLT